jgi:hypothetical protein
MPLRGMNVRVNLKIGITSIARILLNTKSRVAFGSLFVYNKLKQMQKMMMGIGFTFCCSSESGKGASRFMASGSLHPGVIG